MKSTLLKLLIVALILPVLVLAHGGRTNSEGCHNNRKTGDYHCHNGESAKANSPQNIRSSPVGNPSSCGNKRTCKEMDSCAEARQYLECGLKRLDRDNDGIPCESICGSG